jgi:acyl dehydratase
MTVAAKPDSSLVLAAKTFTLEDQLDFALFSGDRNPIHIDPVAARRTLTGQCIVHGMHGLLWALEALLLKHALCVTHFKIRFLKPVFLNEAIVCSYNPKNNRITLETEGVVLVTIAVTLGTATLVELHDEAPRAQPTQPDSPSFSQCSAPGPRSLELAGEPAIARKLFPAFCQSYGLATAAELGAASYLVGMKCPGEHSLFASLTGVLAPSANPYGYSVISSDERFSLIQLAFQGKALSAAVEAFYRPKPTRNQPIAQLGQRVSAGEFKAVRALIIGGSRGLGEIVAKLIAAGGGEVTVTYHVGQADAQALCQDISDWGGACTYTQYTAGTSANTDIDYSQFNQIYYFATPKIVGKRASAFDQAQRHSYQTAYVEAFKTLCTEVLSTQQSCTVFYPSTVFIDGTPKGLEDYAAAKLEGEAFCKQMNAQQNTVKVLIQRLPQLATDQNQALVESQMADLVDCLLPMIRDMQTGQPFKAA